MELFFLSSSFDFHLYVLQSLALNTFETLSVPNSFGGKQQNRNHENINTAVNGHNFKSDQESASDYHTVKSQ